ncbi:MAG: transglycosylase SLT domain-containing protein [Thiotrichales bacterium]
MKKMLLLVTLTVFCTGMVTAAVGSIPTVSQYEETVRQAPVDFEFSKYDRLFRKYTELFFGDKIDWRVFKSQAIVESRLKHDSISERGAVGLMQVLPTTFAEIQQRHELFKGKQLEHPEWNIAAGIFYTRYLYERWSKRRGLSDEKRLLLAFASYNAGFERVSQAMRKTGVKPSSWRRVEPHVPRQTRDYVARINEVTVSLVDSIDEVDSPEELISLVMNETPMRDL